MEQPAMRPLTIALMLESDGPGGAEIVVLEMADELRARGHEVVPVGPGDGVGWLGERLRARGFEPEVFVEGRPPDWRVVRDLLRIFRRRGVDVAHAHEFTLSVYGAAAARLARIPQIVTMHGNQEMTRALRRRVALRWAFGRSAGVVAVSSATQHQLERDLGLAPGSIAVIRNGMPVRPGDPAPVRRELGVAEGEVLLVAVGNLDRRKGHIFLLEALAMLRDRCPVAWRLAIASGRSGDERPRLEAFARERGLAERVHILRHRDDVPALLAAADVFVMPSLWEGLPLALLEAMLAGSAVVASETSGIPEAIANGEDGLLVPPGDSAALAHALERLLRDGGLRARLAAHARERALREFTIGAMVDAYEALYAEAASR